MKIYNSKGKFYIPDGKKKYKEKEGEKVIIDKCYCKNGHNLISPRLKFSEFNGIYLKAKNKNAMGILD